MDHATAGQYVPERDSGDPKQCNAREGEKRGEEKRGRPRRPRGEGGKHRRGKEGERSRKHQDVATTQSVYLIAYLSPNFTTT